MNFATRDCTLPLLPFSHRSHPSHPSSPFAPDPSSTPTSHLHFTTPHFFRISISLSIHLSSLTFLSSSRSARLPLPPPACCITLVHCSSFSHPPPSIPTHPPFLSGRLPYQIRPCVIRKREREREIACWIRGGAGMKFYDLIVETCHMKSVCVRVCVCWWVAGWLGGWVRAKCGRPLYPL